MCMEFVLVFKTFEELLSLASAGDYRNIHKTGTDLKSAEAGDDGDMYANIPDDLVAFNFGKGYKDARGYLDLDCFHNNIKMLQL